MKVPGSIPGSATQVFNGWGLVPILDLSDNVFPVSTAGSGARLLIERSLVRTQARERRNTCITTVGRESWLLFTQVSGDDAHLT